MTIRNEYTVEWNEGQTQSKEKRYANLDREAEIPYYTSQIRFLHIAPGDVKGI